MKDKFNPRDTVSKLPGKAKSEAKALEKTPSVPRPKSTPSAPAKSKLAPNKAPKLVQLKAQGIQSKTSGKLGVASVDPKTALRNKGVKQMVEMSKQAGPAKQAEPESRKEVTMDTFTAELNTLFESMQGASAQAAYAAAFAACTTELGKAAVEAKRRGQ